MQASADPHMSNSDTALPVDVVVAFQEKGQKNETGIYKELVQIPITGVLPAGHPLAEKELLDEDDLQD